MNKQPLAARIEAIAAATATALEDAATAGAGAQTELPEGLKSLEERRDKLADDGSGEQGHARQGRRVRSELHTDGSDRRQ